jgi:hypothetical protein
LFICELVCKGNWPSESMYEICLFRNKILLFLNKSLYEVFLNVRLLTITLILIHNCLLNGNISSSKVRCRSCSGNEDLFILRMLCCSGFPYYPDEKFFSALRYAKVLVVYVMILRNRYWFAGQYTVGVSNFKWVTSQLIKSERDYCNRSSSVIGKELTALSVNLTSSDTLVKCCHLVLPFSDIANTVATHKHSVNMQFLQLIVSVCVAILLPWTFQIISNWMMYKVYVFDIYCHNFHYRSPIIFRVPYPRFLLNLF